MKYFLDTEFLEGSQERPLILKGKLGNWMIGKPKPTIDLISIGIVAEDGREYYAISKEFNLKEAWNRWQHSFNLNAKLNEEVPCKEYWLRENVLKPVFLELLNKDNNFRKEPSFYEKFPNIGTFTNDFKNVYFTYEKLRYLINKYGKTTKQIAEEVKDFCITDYSIAKDDNCNVITWVKETPTILGVIKEMHNPIIIKHSLPEFYAYYADYDWVAFCWLFGTMNDLPYSFPMYCIDLKQELDKKIDFIASIEMLDFNQNFKVVSFEDKLKTVKSMLDYPKQTNEHNALADAKWNFELYKFLKQL